MKVMVVRARQMAAGILCAALVAAVPLTAALISKGELASVTTAGWGIHFESPGQPPVGNATAKELARYDGWFMGDGSKKVLYLTFDAGYENGHTPAILDALKKHNAPATFFLVEHYLDTQPDLVKRMVAEGHVVGNHTATHPDMSTLSDDRFEQELQTLADKYEALTGQPLHRLYRPPQGNYSEENLRLAKRLGYATVFWSAAYVDWQNDAQPDRAQALTTLRERTHPGAIVLLHLTSATNAAILDELLSGWEKEGYSFGKLTDLCQK
ncbi:MAG: polysaccharide deacetylase family protein [Acutalibacteraceae bacterium]|jgi:peptidoglycan-N-acetylmuramic acid deacetylase